MAQDQEESMEKHWELFTKRALLGKKITGVRYMTEKEAEIMGWTNRSIILTLSDGTLIYPSQDDEGNDGGALFGQTNQQKPITFPVI